MASIYGANHTKAFQTIPATNLDVGLMGGRIRAVYDSYALTSSAPANSDKLYMGRLPKGARVTGARLTCDDLGTVGTLNVGYEYVNSADGSAVTNAFFASVDVHTAASDAAMVGTVAGYMFELLGDAYIVVTVTTAWDATSGNIKLKVEYTLD